MGGLSKGCHFQRTADIAQEQISHDDRLELKVVSNKGRFIYLEEQTVKGTVLYFAADNLGAQDLSFVHARSEQKETLLL